MIDHFRSLALNISPSGLTSPLTAYNVHISPDYAVLPLPLDLTEVYDIFYPSPNLVPKLQLTHAYMALLHGCGLEEAITALDPRVTYDIENPNAYFTQRALSTGAPTTTEAKNPLIALRVFNYEYSPAWLDARITRTVSIEQQTNTNNVNIYEDSTQIGSGTLTFSGGRSNLISVSNPDNPKNKLFDFYIQHPASPAFTSTSGKKWTVTFTIPVLDLISRQMSICRAKLGSINGVLSRYGASPSASSHDQLWTSHFNDNYRLAGLFVGLIYRMNALRG